MFDFLKKSTTGAATITIISGAGTLLAITEPGLPLLAKGIAAAFYGYVVARLWFSK